MDLLLDGVIRTRGRLWLASQRDHAMWLESAGGGLRVSSAGKWLAAMAGSELADVDTERRTFAELAWDDQYGDRHTAMTILVCGAAAAEILDALHGALLTDDELRLSAGLGPLRRSVRRLARRPCVPCRRLTTHLPTTPGRDRR